eukprot:8053607-Pyramimonas_sp.AAC.1
MPPIIIRALVLCERVKHPERLVKLMQHALRFLQSPVDLLDPKSRGRGQQSPKRPECCIPMRQIMVMQRPGVPRSNHHRLARSTAGTLCRKKPAKDTT